MKKQGYKEMLSDRCPKVVNFALKWCKAKSRWITHVYDCFIRVIGQETRNGVVVKTKKDNKKAAARIVLGLKKGKPLNFSFKETIDWENLTDEETQYWNWVEGWVSWFSVRYAYIENDYSISRKTGKYVETVFIEHICSTYLPNFADNERKKLAKFLISCIEGNIHLIMYGVFSNYLMKRYAKRTEDKLKNVLDHMNELSIAKSQKEYDPVLSDHTVICLSPLTRNESFVDKQYVYECLTNRHISLLIRWINKNIILDIYTGGQLHHYTTQVRIRIVTCMMNSLVNKGLVDKNYAILFHEILVANVTDLIHGLLDEELPFL